MHKRLNSRRSIPAVNRLLEEVLNTVDLPRPVIVDLVRKEIAELRDTTINVVSVRVHRGLKKLGSILGKPHA